MRQPHERRRPMQDCTMTDHADKATEHLDAALEGEQGWLHIAAAGVHALLHVADTIRHGLRDVVYEMRD